MNKLHTDFISAQDILHELFSLTETHYSEACIPHHEHLQKELVKQLARVLGDYLTPGFHPALQTGRPSGAWFKQELRLHSPNESSDNSTPEEFPVCRKYILKLKRLCQESPIALGKFNEDRMNKLHTDLISAQDILHELFSLTETHYIEACVRAVNVCRRNLLSSWREWLDGYFTPGFTRRYKQDASPGRGSNRNCDCTARMKVLIVQLRRSFLFIENIS